MTEVGENEAVTPAGAPLAVRATVWADPAVRAVVMVLVAELPAVTVSDVGLAEMEKSLAGAVAFTLSDTEVVWLPEAAVPLTVSG